MYNDLTNTGAFTGVKIHYIRSVFEYKALCSMMGDNIITKSNHYIDCKWMHSIAATT